MASTLSDLTFEAWFIEPGREDVVKRIKYSRNDEKVFGLEIPEVILTHAWYGDHRLEQTGQFELQNELRDNKPVYVWRPM